LNYNSFNEGDKELFRGLRKILRVAWFLEKAWKEQHAYWVWYRLLELNQ